ncbi:MAG: Lrp/AsnC family transcriptional regulator [Fimbriimonadaceae bacterium]|nr:Lrp/AsnC family transcriptional regulator [Fimbriimonadaceae bacterium]
MTERQRHQLLEILQADARVAAAEAATRLGLAEAEVAAEIERLEAAGVIKAYRAIVDWDKVGGPHIYAFVDVRVKPEPDFGFDAIAKRLALFEEVHSLYLISGRQDLLLVIEGRDYREVALFVAEKLAPMKGVESTATSFVLRKYKLDGQMMLNETETQRLAVAP